jgi:RHS repeat-associated protein
VGDFDGDGLTDFAQYVPGSAGVLVCYSGGNGTFSCVNKSLPTVSGGQLLVGDFNGDGLTDFVEVGTSGIETCLSAGRSTDNNCNNTTPSGYTNFGGTGTHFLAGDYDGDGLADVLEVSDGSANVQLLYSNGDGTFGVFFPTLPGSVTFSTNGQSSWFVGDFNGDGLTDYAIFSVNANGGSGGLFTCLSTGRTSNPNCYSSSATVPTKSGGGVYTPSFVADLNGDGRADIVTFLGTSSTQVCYTNSLPENTTCTDVTQPSMPTTPIYLVDNFTGYGVASILTSSVLSDSVYLNFISQTYPNLLTAVTDGLGAQTLINYEPLTNSAVYQPSGSIPANGQAVQNSTYVVSNVYEPDGIGGTYAINYNYTGAARDLQGRGFLGFSEVVRKDAIHNSQLLTYYGQAYPYIGYANNVYLWIYANSAWRSYVAKTYTYANTNFGGTRDFVYLQSELDTYDDFNNLGTTIYTVNTQNAYDTYGNLTSTSATMSDGYQKVTTNTYNNSGGSVGSGSIWYLGQLATMQQVNTNPDGATLTRDMAYTYSSASLPNEVTGETLSGSASSDSVTKTYTYDSWGNKNSVRMTGTGLFSPRTTLITYDALGQFPTTTTNPLNQVETRTYDPRFGTMNKSIDLNGLTTTWSFDVLGREINETRPDGTQTNITYSVCTSGCSGQAYNVQVTNTGAPTTTTYFDLLDRDYQKSTGGFNSNMIWEYKTYDQLGRLASSSRKMYSTDTPYYTKYTYDDANRIRYEYDPDGSSKQWVYNGFSTTITNNNQQTRTEVKNSLGELTQVTDAAGQTTLYSYDPFGNLSTTTDPLGNKIVLTYDALGRRTGLVDPDLGTWSYKYDAAGDLVGQTDSKGQTQTLTYDLLGRMLTRQSTEFTGAWTYDTAVNGVGKLANVTNSSGYSKSYTYDSLSRVINEQTTTDTAYNIGTSYDSSGRVSQITYPTGFAVSYSYDANGYLKEMDNSATSAMLWQRNSQNADNRPLQETLGNGVVSNSTYYGPTGRLNTVVATSGSTQVQNLSLTYDYLGNLTERTDLINQHTGAKLSETYTYDNLNRLLSSVNPQVTKSFSYDVLGDLISKTDVGSMKYGDGRSTRPLHAVMSTNGPTQLTFSYDANGNMISGDGKTFAWTSFNKPSNVSNANNNVAFSYDPNFERYKEVETTCTDYLGNTSSTCTKYLINPQQSTGIHFEKEINGSITTNRHFLYAGQGNVIGVYITRSDGSVATDYFHKDHLGSIVLTTTDNGTVVERLSYDPFGKRRNNFGTDDPNDLLTSIASRQGFTGHEHLDDGGLALIDMNGRVYDPFVGRFLSADPYIQNPSNPQNLNRYSYVMNNPLSLVDPSGYWFGNDVVNALGSAAHAVASAASTVSHFVGSNARTIAIVAGIAAVTVATFGAADAVIAGAIGAGTFAGMGAAALAGAIAGGVAGGLASKLLGGGFSWKAVATGVAIGIATGPLTETGLAGLMSQVGDGALDIAEDAGAEGLERGFSSLISGRNVWSGFTSGLKAGALSGWQDFKNSITGGASLTSFLNGALSPVVDSATGAVGDYISDNLSVDTSGLQNYYGLSTSVLQGTLGQGALGTIIGNSVPLLGPFSVEGYNNVFGECY